MGTDPGAEGPRGRAGAHGVQAEPVAQRVVGCPRSPLHRLRDSCFTFSSIHLSIHRIHPSVIHPSTHPPIIRHPSNHPSAHSPRCLCRAGRAILSVLPSLAVTPPPTARRPSAPRGPSRSCPHTSGVTGVGPRQADFALSCRATQTCPVPGVRGRVRPRCDGSVRAGSPSHLSPRQEGGAGSTQRLGRLLCRISRGLPAPLTAPGAARWRPRVGAHEHSSHCRRRPPAVRDAGLPSALRRPRDALRRPAPRTGRASPAASRARPRANRLLC